MPLTIENMNRICDMFNLEYSVTNDAVFIKTPFGRWIVYLKGDEVKEPVSYTHLDVYKRQLWINDDNIYFSISEFSVILNVN